jgi:hypothetical protein
MWMGILAVFAVLVYISVGITSILACYALQQTLNTLVRAQQSGLAQPSSPQQHPPHRGHALGYHTSGDGGIQSTTTTAPPNGADPSAFNTLAPPTDTSAVATASVPQPSSSSRVITTTTTKQNAATATTHLFIAMRRLWLILASALIVLIGVTIIDANTVVKRFSSPFHSLSLGNKQTWSFNFAYLFVYFGMSVLIWWAWVPLRPKMKSAVVVAPAPHTLPQQHRTQQSHPLPIIIVHHYRAPMLSSPREL